MPATDKGVPYADTVNYELHHDLHEKNFNVIFELITRKS